MEELGCLLLLHSPGEMMDADLTQAMESKEAGNLHFKNHEYLEAIECYSRALQECPEGHKSKAVFLKNRAACHLKLQQYSLALSDCSQALCIDPDDVKSLYRRALAYEASGNLTDAFTDLKYLLKIEPRNKEGTELARKLTTTMKKQHDKLQSTEGIVKEMFQALQDRNLPQSKVITAAKNCAILSRENAGAEKLYEAGAIEILLPLLESQSIEVIHHVLQTFAGMCAGHKLCAYVVLQKITLGKLSSLIGHQSSQVSCSAIAVVKQVLIAASSNADGDADSSGLIAECVQAVLELLLDQAITSSGRDQILEMFISTIPKVTNIEIESSRPPY